MQELTTARSDAEGSMESLHSPNISDMYAVADKKAKSSNSLHETSI